MRRFLRVRSRLSRPDTSRVFTCASGRVKPSVKAFRANDGCRVPLAAAPALTDISPARLRHRPRPSRRLAPSDRGSPGRRESGPR